MYELGVMHMLMNRVMKIRKAPRWWMTAYHCFEIKHFIERYFKYKQEMKAVMILDKEVYQGMHKTVEQSKNTYFFTSSVYLSTTHSVSLDHPNNFLPEIPISLQSAPTTVLRLSMIYISS
jgi:hypothetical protein